MGKWAITTAVTLRRRYDVEADDVLQAIDLTYFLLPAGEVLESEEILVATPLWEDSP